MAGVGNSVGRKVFAVVGAGAAGCFCAIQAKRRHPEAEVLVFEASRRPLAKLAVTGGGRCNLTNSFRGVERLSEVYPRGDRMMRRAFGAFDNEAVMRWFESEGVRLVVQDDECVFPASQDAMQVVGSLESLAGRLGVRTICGKRVERISPPAGEGSFCLSFADGTSAFADKVVVTTGGCTRKTLEAMLPSGVELTDTVPSLFTLRIGDASLCSLMGTVAENAVVGIAGTSFRAGGALLITDWGVSGPAILRLSSYAARHLATSAYTGTLVVNWTGFSQAETQAWIEAARREHPRKFVSSIRPDGIADRLWQHLLDKAGVRREMRWAELGGKGVARMVETLTADCYRITGRARFKEEFVTCGGVALSGVDLRTLESKVCPGLFFAGEVLDVDAVTGGFNLQAAWSTAMAVANAL